MVMHIEMINPVFVFVKSNEIKINISILKRNKMSLKNQGYSIAGFVMGLFMITLLLLFGYFIYFNVRMDNLKQDN